MGEYWKSNARHYCQFCKCWLAENKISVELHEKGNHHKEMVKSKLEHLKRESLKKEKEDKKLNQTIAKMEKGALDSFKRDLAKNPSIAASQYGVTDIQQQQSTDPSQSNLPSKLKRPMTEPIRVTCKTPKFVLKTPTPKPVFGPPDELHSTSNVTVKEAEQRKQPLPATWYEAKTDGEQIYYWNDQTGESTWTMPVKYVSLEQQ